MSPARLEARMDSLFSFPVGRDRAGARRRLGGGFPAPPFRLRSGFTVPPWPRFPRPPCDPGWSDFPNPVLTLAVAHKTFPIAAEFKCSVHVQSATPPVCFVGWFTCEDR